MFVRRGNDFPERAGSICDRSGKNVQYRRKKKSISEISAHVSGHRRVPLDRLVRFGIDERIRAAARKNEGKNVPRVDILFTENNTKSRMEEHKI